MSTRRILAAFLLWSGAAAAQSAGGGFPPSSGGSSGGTTTVTEGPCANQSFSLPAFADNSTNATGVASGPLTLCSIVGFARVQSPIYLKLYDETGTPNPAMDTPRYTIYVPPQESLPVLAPLPFTYGLGFAITWGEATANVTQTTGAPPIGGFNIGYRQ